MGSGRVVIVDDEPDLVGTGSRNLPKNPPVAQTFHRMAGACQIR